jgi:hypothetical protein
MFRLSQIRLLVEILISKSCTKIILRLQLTTLQIVLTQQIVQIAQTPQINRLVIHLQPAQAHHSHQTVIQINQPLQHPPPTKIN